MDLGKKFSQRLRDMADEKDGKTPGGWRGTKGDAMGKPGAEDGEGPDMSEVKARLESLDPAALADIAAELMAGMGEEDVNAMIAKYEGEPAETESAPGAFDEEGNPIPA